MFKASESNGGELTHGPDGSKEVEPHVVNVHVPTYPNSQFWLAYNIAPFAFQQSQDPTHQKIKYVYFKLVLSPHDNSGGSGDDGGGKRIISWGVGAEERWKGKTVFGLFNSGQDYCGKARVDKRAFWFSKDASKEGTLEVQVFRARGRRRVSRVFPEVKANGKGKNDVELVNIGRLKEHNPQRYYQYALIDAIDTPYVIFQYHLRSMRNLHAMGIFPDDLLNPMATRYFCPTREDRPYMAGTHLDTLEEETESEGSYHRIDEEPSDLALTDSDGDEPNDAELGRADLRRRLSVSSTIRLVPSTSSHEPHSPTKRLDENVPTKQPYVSTYNHVRSSSDTIGDGSPMKRLGHAKYASKLFNRTTGEAKTITISGLVDARAHEVDHATQNIDDAHLTTRQHVRTPSPTERDATATTPPSSTRGLSSGTFLAGFFDSALRRKKDSVSIASPTKIGTKAERPIQYHGLQEVRNEDEKGGVGLGIDMSEVMKYEAVRESW